MYSDERFKLLKIIFTLVFLFTSLIPFGEDVDLEKTKYILITTIYGVKCLPNTVYLIKDEEELNKMVALFKRHYPSGHACGYHYSFTFFSNTFTNFYYSCINIECDEFYLNHKDNKKILDFYFNAIKDGNASRYISLKIPSSIQPEIVDEYNFQNIDLFVYDRWSNLPWFELVVSKEIDVSGVEGEEKRLLEKENKLKRINTLKDEINYLTEKYKVKHVDGVKIYFEFGTPLDEIKFKNENIIIHRQFSPYYYYLTVICKPEDYDQLCEDKYLLNNLDGIKILLKKYL